VGGGREDDSRAAAAGARAASYELDIQLGIRPTRRLREYIKYA